MGAAQRKLSRNNGERFLAHGYGCVPCAEWLSRYRTTVLPNGAHVWYKGDVGLWRLRKISASMATKGVYLVRFLDDPVPTKLPLPPARYTTWTRAVRGSWCLQVHLAADPPPLSAGAGLGNLAVLLWPRTRFLTFWGPGLGWFLLFFVLPTPPLSAGPWSG